MKTTRKLLALLLVCALTLGLFVPTLAEGETTPTNIARGKTVTAVDKDGNDESAVENGNGIANIVDGNDNTRWAAEGDMKQSGENGAEANPLQPKTVTIDLGLFCSASDVTKITIKWFALVWAIDYSISTADTNDENTNWTTIYSVQREGSTTQSPVDNITYTQGNAVTDGLTQNTLGRYVRFVFNRINRAGTGSGVSIKEIEIYGTLVSTAPTVEGAWNLAQGQPTVESGHAGEWSSTHLVDGDYEGPWTSEDMKNFQASDNSTDRDGDAQTARWVYVDLGVAGSVISSIRLYYRNLRTWPTEYEIQTSDTPSDNDSWVTIASVTRASYPGTLHDGAGQNITHAGTGDKHYDELTFTSTPAIDYTVPVGRYLRLYVKKVNPQAGRNGVDIYQLEVYGVNPDRYNLPIESITAANLTIQGGQLTPTSLPENCSLAIRGSVLDNVVSDTGAVGGYNIGARNVMMLVRLTNDSDNVHFAEKNLTVTIPDGKSNYPQAAAWFPEVTTPNPKPGVVPTLQEWYGYEGSFKLSADSKIIYNDAANVDLRKAAGVIGESIRDITGLTLTAEAGTASTAKDIYIESLTSDTYNVGAEGYILRIADDGVHIYAPTYTGCVFGAVSVEQMLWLSADKLTVPCGITRDYPAFKVRGLKLDVARTPYRLQMLKDYAKICMWYKLSEYDLHINDNEGVESVNSQERHDEVWNGYTGAHRLQSERFPNLTNATQVKFARVPTGESNVDYATNNADYGGIPIYTKAQWKELTAAVSSYGLSLITEIDTPGHSLAYNKYAEQYPEELKAGLVAAGYTDATAGGVRSSHYPGGANWTSGGTNALELLALSSSDPNAQRAKQFIAALWDEYLSDGTITGNVIHIGADEYWEDYKDDFARFVDAMRQEIRGHLPNAKIRMWGAGCGSGKFSTATTALNTTHEALARDFEVEIWDGNSPIEKAALRLSQGYGVVNCQDAYLYGNPGRTRRDLPNAEFLYYNWDPSMFVFDSPLRGEPGLLGAKTVIWGDETHEGIIEKDQHMRALRSAQIVSEKTWHGDVAGVQPESTFTEYELRANALAEGPGTEIAMTVPSKTSLVLDYDFHNTAGDKVYDTSGNGYDGTITGSGTAADGWLTFDGSTLVTTPVKTLSYPYTVSFDIKLTNDEKTANNGESSILSGYDGRIQVAGKDGKMTADVDYFVRNFNYTVPTGDPVHIDIVGTFQATRLYVNGQLQSFVRQTSDIQINNIADKGNTTAYGSVVLPLQKIGQNLHGALANLKVYNKALTPAQIAGTDNSGLVNVAQSASAGSDAVRTAGNQDGSGNRQPMAFRAVDGETFTDDTNASSELYSYWEGTQGTSALTVDLGEARTISKVDLHWRTGKACGAFNLQTSNDMSTWTTAKEITGNTDIRQSVTLDAPVTARYIRMKGNQSGGGFQLQEMMVYEAVSKTALQTAVTQAASYVTDNSISFGTDDPDEKAVLDAYVLAKAVADSPIATQAEVNAALASLTEISLGSPVLTTMAGAPLSAIPGEGQFKVTVPVTKPAQKRAVLVLASYKNGKLQQVLARDLGSAASASQQFTLGGGADKLRVFLLTDKATLKPHIEAKEYPQS